MYIFCFTVLNFLLHGKHFRASTLVCSYPRHRVYSLIRLREIIIYSSLIFCLVFKPLVIAKIANANMANEKKKSLDS